MEQIREKIAIAAPAERVFDHLTDPMNLLEIWPSMVEISNAKVQADGSHAFDWIYKMAGVRFHGHADTVEVEKGRRRVVRNESGIPSTFRWGYVPGPGGCEVQLDIDYELPGSLLGRLAAPFLRLLNEREARTLLDNLKARIEHGEVHGKRAAG